MEEWNPVFNGMSEMFRSWIVSQHYLSLSFSSHLCLLQQMRQQFEILSPYPCLETDLFHAQSKAGALKYFKAVIFLMIFLCTAHMHVGKLQLLEPCNQLVYGTQHFKERDRNNTPLRNRIGLFMTIYSDFQQISFKCLEESNVHRRILNLFYGNFCL